MTIRFSKPGSTLRIGATTLVVTAGLWFGSATYAQTVNKSASPAPQTLQQILSERDHRFSQLPNSNQRSDGRLQSSTNSQLRGTNTASTRRAPQRYTVAPAIPTSSVQTQSLELNGISGQTAQRLLKTGIIPPRTNGQRSRASVIVSETVPAVSRTTNENVARLTAAPKPAVATVGYNSSAARQKPGVHQLNLVSILQFEQKLVSAYGDQLTVTASGDGRFVRVAIPGLSDRGAEPDSLVMLVDRETGKLQYEGPKPLTAQWHRLMSELDSNTPVVKPFAAADIEAEVLPMPRQVQQVAYQQQDRPQGTQVQGIDGLSGPVFIGRNQETGEMTITGTPEDVAIVKREIARLKQQVRQNQPRPASIPLQNARGNLIQERVQEIYDASYSQINGPANITATDSPNALVVVGSPEAVQAVRDLVQVLDVKPDPQATRDFRTFSLRYISAPDAADRLQRFFGQVTLADGDTRLPATAVEVIPDFRSNQVTVKGSQAIINSAADFLRTIDVASTEPGAVNEVRVVQLKNALASDVAFVIQNAINGGFPNSPQAFAPQATTQGNVQTNQANTDGTGSQLRSAMLSFMTRNEQGELVRSGILFDVQITADANSNSLVITGPAESIPLVVELIKQLDRIPDAESQIKVFELVYSDAQTIFDMLDTLFNSATQNTGQQNAGGGVSNLPLQTGGGADGASLVNLQFAIEPRSNAIIASGPSRDLQVIEDLLNRLDARAVNNFPAKVYRLSNAPAQDVADAINSYLEGRTELIDADPRTATGVPAVNRAVIVTPEVVSNSLIVSALPEYRAEIENIIFSLDRRPPMVHVKVLIAEVDLNAVEEFGIELGLQDSLLFDRGTSVVGGAITDGIGFPFNTATIPNLNATSQGNLAGQALSNLNIGRINSTVGYGGLVLSAGNESVNILMRALKDRQCVRVLSKPQIMTMENLQGRVTIGASVARISGSNTTNFGLTQDITFQDVGVILEVTPRVSPDGLIVLTVNAERSSVGPEATGTAIGTAADGSIIRAQQILRTEAQTTLSARSGQTVVFSGLITEEKSHTERGAPIISDLPLIGPLFKFESDTASRSELLIIMTPTLVTNDSDLTNLNNDAMDRMHWCLSDVADLYGSTGYSPGVEMGEAVETFYPDADPTGTMQPMIQNPGQPALGSGGETIHYPNGSQSRATQRQVEPKARSASQSPYKRR